ncbi:UDP-N-acetylglucosamine 2-epimerase [Nitrosopumilus adriaticus]|uniref:UDP-N-acetylglucosamine 2-epimerase n=1 Tax=Nitrosopumilus adriaticus TaxID=1580092 RepID=UPI00352CD6EB
MTKKILIVTERRADYSKFRPIIRRIQESNKLDYYLVVTGSHLLNEHGNTINEIKKDGFKIKSKFLMYKKTKNDTGAEMILSLSRAIQKLTPIIDKLKPDLILSGFDIGANFAASMIGAHMNIPVAHVEGGEVTGTIDEPIRHSISKFSHLHFTTNKKAKSRLIKMGENPKFIFNVGNSSLDEIIKLKNISREKISSQFKLDPKKPYIVILQHTVTSEIDSVERFIKETLNAVMELDIQAILIHGNADAGGKRISKIFKNYKIKQFNALSFEQYINLLKHSSALVGNSSSGIMEAPFLKIPSINIGTRQTGRLRQKSIIDVDYNKTQIKKAIKKALYDKRFLSQIRRQDKPYGSGHASEKIVKILEKIDLKKIPIQKRLTY